MTLDPRPIRADAAPSGLRLDRDRLARAHWRDLWIDQPETLNVLAALDHPLSDPPRRICHWSPDLRPGTIAPYRALIDGRIDLADPPIGRPRRRLSRLVVGARDFGIVAGTKPLGRA